MARIAVLGGGISGLSTSYYLQKLHPQAQILQFDANPTPGGCIVTKKDNGFIFESGPRSMRVSDRLCPTLDIIADIGLLDDVVPSETGQKDVAIYADKDFIRPFAGNRFTQAWFALGNPALRRTILRNLRKQEINEDADDMSIEDFITKVVRFSRESDARYVIDTFVDAMVQGVYSGSPKKLSARQCLPFSAMFEKKILKAEPAVPYKCESADAELVFSEMTEAKSSAVNFTKGMSMLPERLLKYLEGSENYKMINKKVDKVTGKMVSAAGTEHDVDMVISTIPSNALSKIFDKPIPEVKHNSLLSINLGYNNPIKFEGSGYLIPRRCQNRVAGILLDSTSFPHLPPQLSIFAKGELTWDTIPAVLEEVYEQTGITEAPASIQTYEWKEAFPQYEVGHFRKIKEVEACNDIVISGPSYYNSGVPNCVITSKNLVENLEIPN